MKKWIVALVLAVALSLAIASTASADTCLIEFQGECLLWISV